MQDVGELWLELTSVPPPWDAKGVLQHIIHHNSCFCFKE